MNRWQKKGFQNLHAHSKLILIHIEDNLNDKGQFDLSMKILRIALKPLTDGEIRAAFKEVEPMLIFTQDRKKVSIRGCNCAIDPLFKNEGDLFSKFIAQFNETRKTKHKTIAKVKTQFTARIKDGYTIQEIIKALENAMSDQFHIDNEFNDLTPEFITRPDKLEKYINYKKKQSKTGVTAIINF